ncbi:MAG TPA: type IV toxin-antitoxin system AbiEi family antitoxin domain-containing protein [Solirubrobacterales bacterium]|nr:type IV toxin-antitoxin system AbiEi family antitoxin domain-containing protein [Solirubrobacterales bacterium]
MRSHHELAELARSQNGVLSYAQLRELGFSKGHIARAHEAGRLQRVHMGVYAIGHTALSDRARATAALLVFPGTAVLSHGSAAWLWGLVPTAPREAEVTVAARGNRRHGLRVHRVWSLPDDERTIYEGLPVTSVARTLVDLAGTSSGRGLSRVVDRARRRSKLDLAAVDRALGRRSGSFGRERLQDVLRLYRQPVFDRARSELLFLDAIHDADLPAPRMNTWVESCEIDAYWETERFAVEVDGWESHGSREAFESDRLRQEDLKLAGIDSIRITARRIEQEPRVVAKRLKLLLMRRRAELGL